VPELAHAASGIKAEASAASPDPVFLVTAIDPRPLDGLVCPGQHEDQSMSRQRMNVQFKRV
jgi:hypothetical protein